ncbi:ubiquitin carboxyl-terminal hydrolase 24-like isoform X2 [Tachypleus tridentatus]|uniref:ubiquitin carboxyl-terminal hydrolase 24-like isoform X2 n=1 Tax=Tachypleus tridentatus TaxID=6853 RepID=UPI003FD05857
MDQEEEKHISTLQSMGFIDVEEVRRALRLSKNDINEAVAILTNERSSSYLFSDRDVEMRDTGISSSLVVSGCAPPPYIQGEGNLQQNEGDANSLEFPTTHLYELESRVFTDHWSIPYKKEESLGKCLISATLLSREGLFEADENCRRFMEQCMPEAFTKLLTSRAVRSWGLEIQKGVYDMLLLLVDLVAARLKHEPVPDKLLSYVLAMVFDPDTEFHEKNKQRPSSTVHWTDVFGAGNTFATSRNATEPCGWLVDIINRFGQRGGFAEIQKHFQSLSLNGMSMAALLMPLSKCVEYLNTSKVCPFLSPCMDRSVEYIKSLTDSHLKNKNIGSISELIKAMRILCLHLWAQQNQVELMNQLQLDIILRMLKCPHFNAKMNGLKELTKLIEDTSVVRSTKIAINSDKLLNWLAENKVLSIALEGNIDHVQYTDKIKGIIEFTGPKLSLEELSKIWQMQEGQNMHIVDNIHTIMAAASAKFNAQQFDHLLSLVQKGWHGGSDQMRKRLISFIGKIGKETSQGRTSTKIQVLDVLWELTRSPDLPRHLIEQAQEELLNILNEISHKDQTKKNYLIRCLDDIKKGAYVMLSLKLIHEISQNILKSGLYKQDKAVIHDMNKTHDVVKLVTSSLSRCHKQSVAIAGGKPLNPTMLVDGRYSHEECVVSHLSFLQFLLQDGSQYLPWSRSKEVWETLVSNSESCEIDREICYEWFTQCLQDLETDTQSQLFQQKLLKLDSSQLSSKGFRCFKTYFESVNIAEHKLRRSVTDVIVEKLDLTGLDFLWQIALTSPWEDIAEMAIDNLMKMSYHSVSAKLKKQDPESLHLKFINDCYSRLESEVSTVSGTAMSTAVSNATKTLTAMSVTSVASLTLPTRTARLQNIRRLLQLAIRYVSSIEELHTAPRSILPHGAFFIGYPLTLRVVLDSVKEEKFLTLQSHSNETLGSIRQRISQMVKQIPDQLQLSVGDNVLAVTKDQKLLGQLEIEEGQVVTVKFTTSSSASLVIQGSQDEVFGPASLPSTSQIANVPTVTFNSASETGAFGGSPFSSHQNFLLEQEKMLPGVVMSRGGQVFEKLYQLVLLEDQKITQCVKNLLQLIPTNPSVLDAFDSVSTKKVTDLPSPPELSGKNSPRASPKKAHSSALRASKEILKNLLDVSAPELTPFRLLYNLEVLSGRLIPTTCDATTLQSAQVFCENFLRDGGLRLVLNLLQPDSLLQEVDYDVRQGCYFISVQIARYLLCGYSTITLTESGLPVSVTKPSTPKKTVEFSLTSTLPTSSAVIGFKTSQSVRAIQGLSKADLLTILTCIMRIAWAAAAGQLHLAATPLPAKESGVMTGRKSRQSSTGSTNSNSSDGDGQYLHAGVCVQHHSVGYKDILLARECLEFLVTCIHQRPESFALFTKMSCVNDFIIDMLLGSPSRDIRLQALKQFHRLSQVHIPILKDDSSPRYFLLHVLLQAHLPLWISSSNTRGTNLRLLSQCQEFFELCCKLLNGLNATAQHTLHLNPVQRLDDEISWLQVFTPSDTTNLKAADSALLAGHLNFLRTLLTCEGIVKKDVGKTLIPDILNNFLFPASHLIIDSTSTNLTSSAASSNPKCCTIEARKAACEVLVELSHDCWENNEQIVSSLIKMHHHFKPELAREYEYEPLVAGRAESGYVGLKNAGATCYMNSVIQQLYMQPGIREALLTVEEGSPDEDSLFYQIQTVFGHLLESRLQYYIPERFWKCFCLWGQPVNVREQQDAFEFFTHLVDQLDEHLKQIGKDPVFKFCYEGLFSDQKICQGCPHRYEREETFMALNLPVKSHSLLDSLEQFVKGELLEGDNAYFCEKCGEKRNTIKRTCIKSFPHVLVIQLKRFEYDWEANRAIKFDDVFKFPWKLDITPYTVEGIQERDVVNSSMQKNEEELSSPATISKANSAVYDLVGVVVHSGQANAGHYYSYIKERKNDTMVTQGKWIKFNDITVEEFLMTEDSLECECFGGTYKAKVSDSANSYPEIRQRYWNAYMLFYERLEEQAKTPRTPRKISGRFSFKKGDSASTCNRTPRKSAVQSGSTVRQRDSLSQLTHLVDKGERQGLFVDKMPASIQQSVREENLRFMHNCEVYNDQYFSFIQHLVDINLDTVFSPNHSVLLVQSLKLAINFLFNTYLRYKRKTSAIMNEWVNRIESIVSISKEAAFWMLDFLSSDQGISYLKPHLLECPLREVRQVMASILEKAIISFFHHGGKTASHSLNKVIVHLVSLLNQGVPDNCRSCSQYFRLFSSYSQMSISACSHLFECGFFKKSLVFVLGVSGADMECVESTPRRWSSAQVRDFGPLYETLATLILACDLTPYRTCGKEKLPTGPRSTVPMPEEVKLALYGPGSFRLIREFVSASREVSGSISTVVEMFVQGSLYNENFTSAIIYEVVTQYSSVPSNELKNLSHLMLELLVLEDSLQYKRIEHVIDGWVDAKGVRVDGMIDIIRSNQTNDSRRSYQGVKYLVSLAHKCALAKEYLLQAPTKWQWAVNWLKQMMSEHGGWAVQSTIPQSNEDSNTKTFQRTVSAQDTLAEATALLVELESPDTQDVVMDDYDGLQMKIAEEEEKDSNNGLKRVPGMDYLDAIDH